MNLHRKSRVCRPETGHLPRGGVRLSPSAAISPRRCRPRVWSAVVPLLLVWLPLASFGARGVLRFAWLSDTHIGSSMAEQDLRASVADINSLAGLSFVIVSGDVTE